VNDHTSLLYDVDHALSTSNTLIYPASRMLTSNIRSRLSRVLIMSASERMIPDV